MRPTMLAAAWLQNQCQEPVIVSSRSAATSDPETATYQVRTLQQRCFPIRSVRPFARARDVPKSVERMDIKVQH
jgi:hypothetical protein